MKKNEFAPPSLIRDLLIGYSLGAANIIPGVSGGTFLLIFNIYVRVFLILNQINKDTLFEAMGILWSLICKSERGKTLYRLKDFLSRNDFYFLITLLVGAVIAITSLSSLIRYLIVYHFSVTYALFLGLIFMSILIPVKLLKSKKAGLFFWGVLGAVITIYITVSANPYDKIEMKSQLYKIQKETMNDSESNHLNAPNKKTKTIFPFSGKYTIKEYLYASLCGAVSVSAMVLPGISGSLVLILMGAYFEVVSAISALKTLNVDNILFLLCFSLGIILGGLLFARLVSAVLKRFYDPVMAFLTGLMTGSLFALWPFKKSIIMAEQYTKKNGFILLEENVKVYTNINQLPVLDSEFFLSFAAFITGCVIMRFFVKNKVRQ